MKTLFHLDQRANSSRRIIALASWWAALWLGVLAARAGLVPSYPLMYLTPDQTRQMQAAHTQTTPLSMSAVPGIVPNPPPAFSLLPLLAYIPAERNQGSCGDCWAWAGTGVMEIAHAVRSGVRDRLSVQFLNSCNPYVSCCNGGWLANVAQFYSYKGFAIPWSNTNASFLSGSGSCSSALCGNIATAPRYPITSIGVTSIPTWGTGSAQAIANIKNALLQSNTVWFAFFMATDADWQTFFNFWYSQPESSQWTNFFAGQAPSSEEGHAVLCVGYDDTDPAGPCWIMLNSWGTTSGRPNGLFRVSQNLNYDTSDTTGFNLLYWETLNMQFAPPSPPTLTFGLSGANTVVLSWPATATGFTLQQTASLDMPIWLSLTNTPTVVNGRDQVILPMISPTCFFRLFSP